MKKYFVPALIALMLCSPLTLLAGSAVQPETSTEVGTVYYRMYTPLRESRYPTSKGVGAEIVGEKTPTTASIWKFVQRTDGSLDIVNAVDHSYISPASANNTALKTSSASPSEGWTLAPAATAGYFIIKSGSAQFNQTNTSSHGYKVFNWGGGNNTTDAGCQYAFEEVEYTPMDINDALSENYGDTWVRIKMYRDNSYSAGVDGTGNGAAGTTQVCDLTATGELWCMVGNTNAFKLYNKTTGSDYALKVDGTAEASAATMAAAASATTWLLIDKDGGYAIVPSNATGMSINAYGGKGGNLKLYQANDQGGWWRFDIIGKHTLTLSVEVEGEPWEENPRVAEMNMTINGTSSSSRITGSVEGKTFYLPIDAIDFSLSSTTYRGYTFTGFEDTQGTVVSSFTNAKLTESINVTARYRTNNWRTLYYTPRDGHPYRIPAITAAPNGDIFAICDYRPCGGDIGNGDVDLVCRISTDNGASWGEEICLANGEGHGASETWKVGYGDPAIVADSEHNEVLVMSVCGNRLCWDGNYGAGTADNPENPNRVSRIRIKYDEATQQWIPGKPEEVTYDIYPLFKDQSGKVHVGSLFIGAGKICQSHVVKKDKYYRIYCSVWAVATGSSRHHNYVIYSDDFGESWSLLGNLGFDYSPAQYGNEPKCEELPDGTVVLSSRKSAGRYFNLFTFDDDTYTTGAWGTTASSNDIQGGLSFGGNDTNGEVLLVNAIRKSDGAACDLMLQSVPTGDGRSDVAIFYKEMAYNADGTNKYTPTTFAQGWTKGIQASDRGSAYSTMTMQKDGRVGFLYEEEPGGYCIVYAPLTIEEITNGAYTGPTPTGIECPVTSSQGNAGIYDLTGRKLDKATESGIYIINGKKVVM